MKDETIVINDRAQLTPYRLYSPKELRVSKRPAVLVFPGGAYAFCSDREAEPIAIAFNNAGFDAFVLKYTVRKGFDEAFKDGNAALKYLMERKEELHINKLLVCGFSAGAHLACSMGTVSDVKPDGMILVYPPLIQKEWEKMCPSAIDLLDKIDNTTPPTFIVHAIDDPVVPIHNSYWLMEKLDNAKVPFEAHIYREGGHGFSLANPTISGGRKDYQYNAKATWMPMCITWIREGIADIEYNEEEDDLGNKIPAVLQNSLNELCKNEKVKAIITAFDPAFTTKQTLDSAGAFSFATILVNVKTHTIEEIYKLAMQIDDVTE